MHVRAAWEKKDAYNNNNDKNKNKWCLVSSCVFESVYTTYRFIPSGRSMVVFTATPCSPQHHGHTAIRPHVGAVCLWL